MAITTANPHSCLPRAALQIAGRYKYSIYDRLIIAAALETGCNLVYSEELHDGQVIENSLTIRNPFKS